MPKKRTPFNCLFVAEGNNGGSYIRIEPTDRPDVVRLDVGHDCVGRIDREVNVAALAAVLARADEEGFAALITRLYAGDPKPATTMGPL